MVKGTRNLFGEEAKTLTNIIKKLSNFVEDQGYNIFIPSSLASQQVFVDKAGSEILNQMYSFKDKGDRDICLIPEVTAIVQKEYNEHWINTMHKPVKVYYATRCYRYEQPQAGRYREFWQFGVECLGGRETDLAEVQILLQTCLTEVGLSEDSFKMNFFVERGLDYYVGSGFEVEVPTLGAQKQIAGGGKYKEGIGWAIGIDRLMLALEQRV